jgi:PAS domain-containing protein
VASACLFLAALAALAVAEPALGPWLVGTIGACSLIAMMAHGLSLEVVNVEKRWLLALGGAGLGVGEWRMGNDVGRTSAQWKLLMGDVSVSLSGWLARLHDDDRAAVRDTLARLRGGQQSRARHEVRARSGDGWRWLDAQFVAIGRSHGGEVSHLIATLSDSSDRHDAQERQQLAASLFQHLHQGLLIADAEMRVLDANPAYAQILGVSRAELIGAVPSLLRPATSDPLARQQRLLMWSALRSTGHWRGEVVAPEPQQKWC